MIDRVQYNIDRFFRWFRHRHENIKALNVASPPKVDDKPTSFVPEQYVLIGSVLDAMANHWDASFRPNPPKAPPHADRLQDFLHTMANSTGIFDRVSGPLLRKAVQQQLPASYPAVEQAVGSFESTGAVRGWEHDLAYVTLLGNPSLAEPKLQKLIRDHRFGALLYRLIRCQWVHELMESPDVGHPSHDSRIRYENTHKLSDTVGWKLTHPLILPVDRLLEFEEEAINSFEHACVAQRIDPTPSHED